MVAAVEGFIQLPVDTGNTGKKKHTIRRTIGANSVDEDVIVIGEARDITGAYMVASPPIVIPALAQTGVATGLLWIYNPVANTKVMQLSRVTIMHQFVALAVDLLAGDLRCSRFTFMGVNAGAQLTVGKVHSAGSAPAGQVATAWSIAVATLVATLEASFLQTMDLITGGAGHWNPMQDEFIANNKDEQITLLPGEGLVIWNASGVTTGNRRSIVNVNWVEYNP